jgi:hypothetical protein
LHTASRLRLLLAQDLVRTSVGIVSLVVAAEASHVLRRKDPWVFKQHLQLVLRKFVLLAVGRLVSLHAAFVAYNLLTAVACHGHSRVAERPVELSRHVGYRRQAKVLGAHHAFDVHLGAFRPEGTEPNKVVLAQCSLLIGM